MQIKKLLAIMGTILTTLSLPTKATEMEELFSYPPTVAPPVEIYNIIPLSPDELESKLLITQFSSPVRNFIQVFTKGGSKHLATEEDGQLVIEPDIDQNIVPTLIDYNKEILTSLDLSKNEGLCNMNDDFTADVVEAITSCMKLKHIDFKECPNLNVDPLWKIAEYSLSLQQIDLRSCQSITYGNFNPFKEKWKEITFLLDD